MDVSPFLTDIAAGTARASASFYANRVAGDAGTDTRFGLRLAAFRADQFPVVNLGYLADSAVVFDTDADPSTWELVAPPELVLPTDTGYLAMVIFAFENVDLDTTFDGHFADEAWVTIVPEPSTALLLSLGLLGIAAKRRRAN